MSKQQVQDFFNLVATTIVPDGHLMIYGPFNYHGEYTSDSNADFDLWLKAQNPSSGIRDFEWVNMLAQKSGFMFANDNAMPANNRLLHWRLSTRALL